MIPFSYHNFSLLCFEDTQMEPVSILNGPPNDRDFLGSLLLEGKRDEERDRLKSIGFQSPWSVGGPKFYHRRSCCWILGSVVGSKTLNGKIYRVHGSLARS